MNNEMKHSTIALSVNLYKLGFTFEFMPFHWKLSYQYQRGDNFYCSPAISVSFGPFHFCAVYAGNNQ